MICYINDDGGLSALLELSGASFEIGQNALVEFSARRTDPTPECPHRISYALVSRPVSGGLPWVKFDNAHAVEPKKGGYRRKRVEYDHWHQTDSDKGSPYQFTTAAAWLDDFWREVKRALDERGIQNDL